jgi:hypothetical protein
MLSTARSRAIWQLSRRVQVSTVRSFAVSAKGKKEVPNVSKTNELPIETHQRDEAIQESVEDGEKMRVAQAPNRTGIWSRSQSPRAKAMTGPRFEQTIMEFQVCGDYHEEYYGPLATRGAPNMCSNLTNSWIASTPSCNRLDPQAASSMDPRTFCFV